MWLPGVRAGKQHKGSKGKSTCCWMQRPQGSAARPAAWAHELQLCRRDLCWVGASNLPLPNPDTVHSNPPVQPQLVGRLPGAGCCVLWDEPGVGDGLVRSSRGRKGDGGGVLLRGLQGVERGEVGVVGWLVGGWVGELGQCVWMCRGVGACETVAGSSSGACGWMGGMGVGWVVFVCSQCVPVRGMWQCVGGWVGEGGCGVLKNLQGVGGWVHTHTHHHRPPLAPRSRARAGGPLAPC